MKKLFTFIFLLSALSSCGPSKHPIATDTVVSDDTTPHKAEAIVHHKGDFVDITLSIYETEKKDSASILHILSMYEGMPVGFDVYLPENTKGGFGHGLIISSAGIPSDNFLKMLCEVYQHHYDLTSKFCTADTITFADLNKMAELEGGGKNLSGNSMKLFFEKEGKTEDDYKYAEVFLNIDRESNTVEFNEKDPDYRRDLLYFLTQQK